LGHSPTYTSQQSWESSQSLNRCPKALGTSHVPVPKASHTHPIRIPYASQFQAFGTCLGLGHTNAVHLKAQQGKRDCQIIARQSHVMPFQEIVQPLKSHRSHILHHNPSTGEFSARGACKCTHNCQTLSNENAQSLEQLIHCKYRSLIRAERIDVVHYQKCNATVLQLKNGRPSRLVPDLVISLKNPKSTGSSPT
jgi:hypothetical protein